MMGVAIGSSAVAHRLADRRYRERNRGRQGQICNSLALVTLSEEDKYYYKEVLDFNSQYNASAPGDYYELLGVDQEADDGSIKSAFREKQRLVHPDIAGCDFLFPNEIVCHQCHPRRCGC